MTNFPQNMPAKILKICLYLAKMWTKVRGWLFGATLYSLHVCSNHFSDVSWFSSRKWSSAAHLCHHFLLSHSLQWKHWIKSDCVQLNWSIWMRLIRRQWYIAAVVAVTLMHRVQ